MRIAPCKEWLDLFGAGQELARIVQDSHCARGHLQPRPDLCPVCAREKDAIVAWLDAVIAFRKRFLRGAA